MVGQWSSWKVYPQHNLPLADTLHALPSARRVEVQLGDALDYAERKGDLGFLDPPYIGTRANYESDTGGYQPSQTLNLLGRLTIPVIFTYGDGAPDIFPGLPWEVVKKRKVPNLRKGGTVDRTEYVAYINWP